MGLRENINPQGRMNGSYVQRIKVVSRIVTHIEDPRTGSVLLRVNCCWGVSNVLGEVGCRSVDSHNKRVGSSAVGVAGAVVLMSLSMSVSGREFVRFGFNFNAMIMAGREFVHLKLTIARVFSHLESSWMCPRPGIEKPG